MYIINADDYGISEENNKAILEASKFGILKSTVREKGFIF